MEYLLMGGFLTVVGILIVIGTITVRAIVLNNEARLLELAAAYKKIKRNFSFEIRNALTRDTYPCELQEAIDMAFTIEVIFDRAIQNIKEAESK